MSTAKLVDDYVTLQQKLKKGTIKQIENAERLKLLQKIKSKKCGIHKGKKSAVKTFKKVYGDEYIIATVITRLAA